MKKLFVLMAALVAVPAFAQSAKVEMKMADGATIALKRATSKVGATEYGGAWTTLMSGTIKMSQQKDLMIGVSLETSLVTDTSVASSNYNKLTSEAEAGIQVRVLVDGQPVQPGAVTFDRRNQKLTAAFDGFSCQIDPVTQALSGCKYQDEYIQLVLDTTAAHAFFFGITDVGVGTHTIEVQASTWAWGSTSAGVAASALATIGYGAFTVEEVRLVKGSDLGSI